MPSVPHQPSQPSQPIGSSRPPQPIEPHESPEPTPRHPAAWPRRGFLAVTAATAATAATGLVLSAAGPAGAAQRPRPAADFGALRTRWRELLLGSGFDPQAEPYATKLREVADLARTFRRRLKPARGSLFPDAPFDPPSGITLSYTRLLTMAEAYAQPGTEATGDAGLLDAVCSGLSHLHKRAYNADTKRHGNWWDWQIGCPRALLDTMTMLHEKIDAAERRHWLAAVDHFLPESVFDDYKGTSTGANRVDFCRVYALGGILGEQPDKIALARRALSPVFPYVTQGDGLYADGSFVQHTWVPYSGTYGWVMLDGLGRLFALLDGTDWEITDPNRSIVHDSVEKAYAPFVHDGLVMDGVSGRAIARGVLKQDPYRIHQSDHSRGHQLAAAVAVLGRSAGSSRRRRWNALLRGWIERDTALPVLTDRQFPVADLARLHEVAGEPGPTAPAPVEHRLFPAMARAVHRRPDWCAGISMASDRITYYEAGNDENPRGWHTGAGMLYWWGPSGTLNQYGDDFWPTVDPYRLPGTTVSTKRLPDNAGGEWGKPKPDVRWAGGATDGEFAAVGQQLRGLKSTLTARKAWFCVADTIVCLGAGISSRDGAGTEAETIVDNRNLGEHGEHLLTVDGAPQPSAPGAERTFPAARWAHLAGHGGWVFPGGTRLRVRREARTGAWSDIDKGSVDDRITRRYVTLWTSHGTDPTDAGYVYLLMPGADAAALAARAADPDWLRVDANTADVQAVTVPQLGFAAANFHRAGSVGPLSVRGPASVLVRRGRTARGGTTGERTATVTVAGPERDGDPVKLTWRRAVREVVAKDDGVEVVAAGDELRLRATADVSGASLTCTVLLR